MLGFNNYRWFFFGGGVFLLLAKYLLNYTLNGFAEPSQAY